MKNEVRPIDANELANEIASLKIVITGLRAGKGVLEKLMAEYRSSVLRVIDEQKTIEPEIKDHFPDATKMVPLTLEQLRGMDGQPVWVQNLEEPEKSQWRLCHWDRGKYLVLQGISVRGYLLEDYGIGWLAYAYPPAHIDREAWTAEWVKHDGYTECSKCEHWYDSPESEDDGDRPAFCPSCGRAMTPEAWAELEKRMGVRV